MYFCYYYFSSARPPVCSGSRHSLPLKPTRLFVKIIIPALKLACQPKAGINRNLQAFRAVSPRANHKLEPRPSYIRTEYSDPLAPCTPARDTHAPSVLVKRSRIGKVKNVRVGSTERERAVIMGLFKVNTVHSNGSVKDAYDAHSLRPNFLYKPPSRRRRLSGLGRHTKFLTGSSPRCRKACIALLAAESGLASTQTRPCEPVNMACTSRRTPHGFHPRFFRP